MNSDKQFKCPVCGADESPDSKFCGECGSKIEAKPEAKQQTANTDSLSIPVKPVQDDYSERERVRSVPLVQYDPTPPADPLTKPLGVIDYILMIIAFSIPLIGFILMIVWAVSSTTNINRKNFSRAYLIIWIVATILFTIIGVSFATFLFSTMRNLVDSGIINDIYSGNFNPENFFDMSIMSNLIPSLIK